MSSFVHDPDKLIAKIEAAFADGSRAGIGLREASAIDDRLGAGDLYANAESYQQAREADARISEWKKIPFDELARNPSVFSFLDDEGFKFILPAMMRWSMSEGYSDEWDVIGFLLMKLVRYDDSGERPADLVSRLRLDQAQVSVVVEWLSEAVAEWRGDSMNPYEEESMTEWLELASA